MDIGSKLYSHRHINRVDILLSLEELSRKNFQSHFLKFCMSILYVFPQARQTEEVRDTG